MKRAKVLLLAGTSLARNIAVKLAEMPGFDATASLAGVTRSAVALPLPTRTGGFGGADGFASYLQDQKIDAVIDATHPFAVVMSATAHTICQSKNTPYILVQRQPWQSQTGDRWHFIDHAQQAASVIPTGATVFLGTGRQTLPQFGNLAGRRLLCRVIDAPQTTFPFANGEFVTGRPPFSIDEELAFFTSSAIDWLVVKNAGARASYSKLVAARQLGLPVVMINRPQSPAGALVHNSDAAIDWLQKCFAKT